MRFFDLLQPKAYAGKLSRYRGQSFSGITGTMTAALAANSTVAALRFPLSASGVGVLKWIHLHYACIASFSTPVVAGRMLALKRGSNATPSGGSALDVQRDRSNNTDTLWSGAIASTGALTMSGVVYDSAIRARLLLAHAGVSGQDYDELWTFDDPYQLLPGQLVGIVNPNAFDAGGTWQLNIKGAVFEQL